MNLPNLQAPIGWGLAVLAVAMGYTLYGWPGVLLALGIVVFWMLLQFTRVMRAMREASQAPVGHVASAVMLNARLSAGMRLIDIIRLTRSLGQKLSDPPDESYVWRDESGAQVTLHLAASRLVRWQLARPEAAPDQAPDNAAGQAPDQVPDRTPEPPAPAAGPGSAAA